MITQITSVQEARLYELLYEWLKYGLNCEPADFETGDRLIVELYRHMGKPEPIILHLASPLMCELAMNYVFAIISGRETPPVDRSLRKLIDEKIERKDFDDLYLKIYRQLYSKELHRLDGALCRRLGRHYFDQVSQDVRTLIEAKLRRPFDDRFLRQVRYRLEYLLKSHSPKLNQYFLENGWNAEMLFGRAITFLFSHELGVSYDPEDLKLLYLLLDLARNVGWVAVWDGICFVSDRPRTLSFDQNGILHCETGKAIEYRDRWGLTCWHGTVIPDAWLTNESTLTSTNVFRIRKIELRRVAIEILGWHKILHELDAKVIDENPDPGCGTLIEVSLPGVRTKSRFIRGCCGTGREFAVSVPPDIQSVASAQAWLTGLPDAEFSFPTVRT